jgi:2-polyprenyl-3-methyl-5-hydroxy-6-metoxy-1,4-benzoquinol methylase
MVTPGTHQFDKYIRPDEVASFMSKQLKWPVADFETAGVNYLPLKGTWRLGRSTDGVDTLKRPKWDQQANYFFAARKPL